MNDWMKTGIYGFAAAVLIAGATLTRTKTAVPEILKEEGAPFYPEFTDPRQAGSIEVASYDRDTGTVRRFKVESTARGWVIPSHHNYPADAEDRLKKCAASLLDLKKDAFRTEKTSEHDELGVVDPTDEAIISSEGRGLRVTFRNREGNVIADYILGDPVAEESAMRYVRVPGDKRVYKVRVSPELSTKFSDWIERDLLKLERGAIRSMYLDLYRVDERSGRILQQDEIRVERQEEQKWSIDGKEPANDIVVGDMLDTLDDLRIEGVRLKPAGLTRDLKQAQGLRLDDETLASLVSKGFYFVETRSGLALVSNEGEIRVDRDDGVRYTLRFGEVLYGEDDVITAGGKDEGKKKEGKEHRYLFVTANFDASSIPPPKVDPKPESKIADPNEPGIDEDTRRMRLEQRQREDEDWDREAEMQLKLRQAEYDKRRADGEKKAKELNDRFADWYYVIDAASYKKLRVTRADLKKRP